MKIFGKSDRSRRRGPEAWFSGEVWMEEIVSAIAPLRLQAVYVTFEQNARTAWHTHPMGQAFEVITGEGWVQLEGQSAQRITPGDVVRIEPGENHWHGAAAGGRLVHLAMQEADETGTNVVWGKKVTEEEYEAAG